MMLILLVRITTIMSIIMGIRAENSVHGANDLLHNHQELLDLAQGSTLGVRHDIPVEILWRRHWGTSAGVKRNKRWQERAWRETFKPAIPSITIGNVCSLTNMLEEPETLVRTQKMYRESSLICLTETWLTDSIHHSLTRQNTLRPSS